MPGVLTVHRFIIMDMELITLNHKKRLLYGQTSHRSGERLTTLDSKFKVILIEEVQLNSAHY